MKLSEEKFMFKQFLRKS